MSLKVACFVELAHADGEWTVQWYHATSGSVRLHVAVV